MIFFKFVYGLMSIVIIHEERYMKKILKKYGYLPYFLVSILLLANYLLFHNRIYLIFFSYWLFLAFVDFAKKKRNDDK